MKSETHSLKGGVNGHRVMKHVMRNCQSPKMRVITKSNPDSDI